METRTRATQVGGMIKIDINSKDWDMSCTYYIDIAEAGRLKDELTDALQFYDEEMAERDKAANEYMEEGESLDSILTSMEK